MHLLAIDQINIFCKDGQLNGEERAKYANANATAAKYAMTASSFEKGERIDLLPERDELQLDMTFKLRFLYC